MGEPAAWIAAAVLAVAPPFLFHAHVLKSYTLDALFAAALALAWCRWRDRRAGRNLAAFAALGALSFGFSFTGAFVVAACAAGEVWEHRRALRALVSFVVVCAALAALAARRVPRLARRRHRGRLAAGVLRRAVPPRLAGGLGALGSPLVVGVCGTRRGSSRAWRPSPP